MKELLIIRHGEDDSDLTVGGWTDTCLTAHGVKQAIATGERLGAYLGSGTIGFYCSDLKRAAETANTIGDIIGQKPVMLERLREMNNGEAANRTKEAAKALELPMTSPVLEWIPYPGVALRD
ncbi:histidine phosphatase family protein [Brevibacillus fluminis]|uniref:histidine phosphatase family protein n=1 Tax=Brevibacillus fluminis TaxID=511487 RepID=UPI003F8A0D21